MKRWKQVLISTILMNAFYPESSGAATISDRLEQYGDAARARLAPHFARQKTAYPPSQLVFLGLKEEKVLEIYARSPTNGFKFIRSYPILAASGTAGPKLREGDRQVPEGIYPIELLNPNSNYHLSLRIGYPNTFDRAQARKEGRANLGGDIMIHGKAASVGCLAMGDAAAEDLFVLAAETGLEKITVILSPVDFREKKMKLSPKTPAWVKTLYDALSARMKDLPKTKRS